MNRPRIGVVVSQLGFGGAERQTVTLLEELAQDPLRPVFVACLSTDLEPFGAAIRALGYELVVLPRKGSFDASRLLRLRALLRSRGIDVVHAVHLLASAYVYWATRGLRIAMLPSVRGTVVQPGPAKAWTFRRMFRAAPKTLVNSRRGADFIVRHLGAPADRVALVPNGVSFEALRARAVPTRARATLGIPADAPLVAYVGKNSAVKNIPRCVEVIGRVLREIPGSHAVVIGGGLGPADQATLAPGLDRAHAHFVGARNDLPAWLGDADALLLTSDSEGTPNVVLEALGLGVPVVSSDVGDVGSMVLPEGGAVVPSGDVAAYVEALAGILRDRRAARERVRLRWPHLEERYSVTSMAAATKQLWLGAYGAIARRAGA